MMSAWAKKKRRYFESFADEDEFYGCEDDDLDHEYLNQLKYYNDENPEQEDPQNKAIVLTDADISIEVLEGVDWWFSLALNIVLAGKKIPLLPILQSALKVLPQSGRFGEESIDVLNVDGFFYASLPDGQLISLPFEKIREILLALQEFLDGGLSGELRVAPTRAMALLGTDARWSGEEALRKLVEMLRSLVHSEPAIPAKDLRATLRPYQLDGLAWLQKISNLGLGGILADDMGLGKTIQLLAHICARKELGQSSGPTLVVCPKSVLPNWLSESRKFTPSLSVMSHYGGDRRKRLCKIKDKDLVLTTYTTLMLDRQTLSGIQWDMIILDEAQAVKNCFTNVSQAARELNAKSRICATGTPIENNLEELWSHFHFLMPGLLSNLKTFRKYFQRPIEKDHNRERQALLASRTKPFIMRRTKSQVEKDLPEKTTIIHAVELEADQIELYESMRIVLDRQVRDQLVWRSFREIQVLILDALLKLRQVCCDPRLVKLDSARKVTGSAKLDALRLMLKQLVSDGRKILLFSQFTSMLDLIKEILAEEKIEWVEITGQTKDRATPVNLFQNTNVPLFLISLKAGGCGLNLTAADTVIHYDPWWNPAVEDQATDRAHRIGQTKNVFVYKLIASGSIEERMIQLQERKRSIADCLYDPTGSTFPIFTEADLDLLLAPLDPKKSRRN